jgi:hypothetical protein
VRSHQLQERADVVRRHLRRQAKATHAARGTARHGVGSHAEPPTMECAAPVT